MVHLAPCPEKFLLRSSYVVRGLPRSTLPDFPSTAAPLVRSAIALDQIIRRIRASATSGLQLIKRPSHARLDRRPETDTEGAGGDWSPNVAAGAHLRAQGA